MNKYKLGLNIIKKEIKSMPVSPGIYKMIDENDEVLYVGKAKNLKKRVSSYSKLNNQSKRILNMISLVRKVELSITNTEAEALLLESNVIKANKPKFNILLKDDKSFPSILLTSNHDFPQIKKHRGRKSQKGYYFGPFSSAGSVNRSLDALQKGFLLRNCTDNVFKLTTKPCLQYQIKRCTAPCVGLVSKKDYQIQVEQAKNFLNGDSDKIKEIFAEKMQEYSSNLDFENAAVWRNKIRALTSIQSFQSVNINEIGNVDIIAVYRKLNKTSINISFMRNGSNFGDHNFFLSHPLDVKIDKIMLEFLSQFYENKIPPKEIIVSHEPKDKSLLIEALSLLSNHQIRIHSPKKGIRTKLVNISMTNAKTSLNRKISDNEKIFNNLAKLKKIFNLNKDIHRIEIYDNSHIQGKFAVGAMVVFNKDGFDKSSYRKYNLTINENISGGNDFGMMQEVFSRRFKNFDNSKNNNPLPDLILVDGGRGHLNTVSEILTNLKLDKIKICAVSKGKERNAGEEKFHLLGQKSFTLEKNSSIMFFLQKLRDEAHRFAITSHRIRRKQSISYNPINEIDGIGKVRKMALLKYFGSAKEVSRASIEDLKKVNGISNNAARKIYDYFTNK
ncbi:excinuclease ABC subunit UvrC [SAR116 cluster bacterium]|nr:excinuclease ABC subunit UvrC [SAR116 cluster bacterium]